MIAAITFVVVVATVVVAAVIVDVATPSPMTSDTEVEPVIVAVAPAQRSRAVGVGVTVVREDGFAVLFGTSGVVTAMTVAPGDVLDTGDLVVEVEDRPVVGLVAPAPLWRDLATGSRGPDVQRLQQIFMDLGLYNGQIDGRYDVRTRAAATAFNTKFGLSAPRGTFARSSVVWLGPTPIEVAEVFTTAGDRVGEGEAVLGGPGRAASVTVAEPAGGMPVPGVGYDLVIGEQRAPYSPGSGRIDDPDSVAGIAAAIGPAGEGIGQVVTADAIDVLTVPASALVAGADGTTCLFESVDSPPVVVVPLGGGVSQVELPADTPIGVVLVNPQQVRSDTRCS